MEARAIGGSPTSLCAPRSFRRALSSSLPPPYSGGDQKQRGKRQAGPVREPAALSTPAPQLPGPTNNAPARARRTHHPGQRPISTREAGLGHGSASRARQGLLLALRGRPGPPLAPTAARRAPRSALLAAPHGGPKPLRRPRRPPPSNSSAAPGPRARPAEGKEGLAGRRGAASRGPRGGDGDRGGGGEGLQRLARAAWEARA